MLLGACTWCRRYRLVQLLSWRWPKSGQTVCGEVCPHCFYGTGRWDGCRTCRARQARAKDSGRRGVRPLERADILEILAQESARGAGRRRGT